MEGVEEVEEMDVNVDALMVREGEESTTEMRGDTTVKFSNRQSVIWVSVLLRESRDVLNSIEVTAGVVV